MSVCTGLAEEASAGVAQALRAVDCLSAETTAIAFGRLFGANGALAPALTGMPWPSADGLADEMFAGDAGWIEAAE